MILVTGALSEKGLQLINDLPPGTFIAYDNLSAGFERKNLLPAGVEFIFGDVRDEVMLRRVIKDKKIHKIINLARVPEDRSIESYEINLGAVLKLKKISEELQLELILRT